MLVLIVSLDLESLRKLIEEDRCVIQIILTELVKTYMYTVSIVLSKLIQ